jgi:hypothetical protein
MIQKKIELFKNNHQNRLDYLKIIGIIFRETNNEREL